MQREFALRGRSVRLGYKSVLPTCCVPKPTNLFSGRPARGIINRFMTECGPISNAAPAFPLAGAAVAPLRAKAEQRGSGDFSPLWAGQHVRPSNEMPAADLTRQLCD